MNQQVNIAGVDSSSEAKFTLWLSDSDTEDFIVHSSDFQNSKRTMGVNEPQLQRPVFRGFNIFASENSEEEDSNKSRKI